MNVNELSHKVIGAAIEVHRTLGPGLLETVYHQCLEKELNLEESDIFLKLLLRRNTKGLSLMRFTEWICLLRIFSL